MDSISGVLASLGLTDKETTVYLALLSLGTTTASVVAKHTRLPRSTVQFTCQQLQRRGVISMVQRKNVYLFSADDPRRLLSLVEFQQKILERKREDAHRIIGELERLRHPDSAISRVRFYEGEEGVDIAWSSVLDDVQEGGEILGFVHPLEPGKDNASSGLLAFIRRRMSKRIRMRSIATKGARSEALRSMDKETLRETRCTDVPMEGFPSEVMIYGHKICLVTAEKGSVSATVIENRNITELFRTTFEDHWSRLDQREPS